MQTAENHKTVQCAWRTLESCSGLFVPRWYQQGVENIFTSRQGGQSLHPYASLNLGLHVGDDADTVCENRRKIAHELNIDFQQMVFCEQVHGTEVQKVGASHRGRGNQIYQDAVRHTDALITDEKQVYLVLLFADCVPLFFFDPEKRAVGLAHGGWKGAWGEIGLQTIQAMKREFSCQLEDIQCWIAPGIGKCCFEIGEELAEKVRQREGWNTYLSQNENGRTVWDLKQTHYQTLIHAGILKENIVVSGQCTVCGEKEFFSYRRDGQTGRMAAVLGIREKEVV